jgi:hypothetical protein
MWTEYLQKFLSLVWQTNREPCLKMATQIETNRRKCSNCVVQKSSQFHLFNELE